MTDAEYEEATARIEYVDRAKQCTARWIARISDASRCRMFLPAAAREHAIACAAEIIGDLFCDETASARKIIEIWERRDYHAAIREWQS